MRRLSLTTLLAVAVVGSTTGVDGRGDEEADTGKVVEKARKLDREGMWALVGELGRKKDFSALFAIFKAKDVPWGTMAAGELARRMDTDKAIAFCSSLDIGSPNWGSALFGLRDHPKAQVIGYFKQCCTSQSIEARYYCYRIGVAEEWDDFTTSARKDLGCKEGVSAPFASSYETLGDVAKWYLDWVSRP